MQLVSDRGRKIIMNIQNYIPADDQQRLEYQIQLIAEGRKEALAFLYQQTKAAVHAFLLSYLNYYDAEDAMQDTYIGIYRSAKNYQPQGKPMAWIFGIAKYTAFMKIRSSQRETTLPEENWKLIEEELPAINFEEKDLLRNLLLRLSAEEYRIILLHAVSGLKFREISELFNLPLSTTLSKYRRAMKKLKQSWKEESNDEEP